MSVVYSSDSDSDSDDSSVDSRRDSLDVDLDDVFADPEIAHMLALVPADVQRNVQELMVGNSLPTSSKVQVVKALLQNELTSRGASVQRAAPAATSARGSGLALSASSSASTPHGRAPARMETKPGSSSNELCAFCETRGHSLRHCPTYEASNADIRDVTHGTLEEKASAILRVRQAAPHRHLAEALAALEIIKKGMVKAAARTSAHASVRCVFCRESGHRPKDCTAYQPTKVDLYTIKHGTPEEIEQVIQRVRRAVRGPSSSPPPSDHYATSSKASKPPASEATSTCALCRKVGHTLLECPTLRSRESAQKSNVNSDQRADERPKRAPRVVAAASEEICAYCSKVGHRMVECRSYLARNKTSSVSASKTQKPVNNPHNGAHTPEEETHALHSAEASSGPTRAPKTTKPAACVFCGSTDHSRRQECPLEPTNADMSTYLRLRSTKVPGQMQKFLSNLRNGIHVDDRKPEHALPTAIPTCYVCERESHYHSDCPYNPSRTEESALRKLKVARDVEGFAKYAADIRNGIRFPDAEVDAQASRKCNYCDNDFHVPADCPLQPTQTDMIAYHGYLKQGNAKAAQKVKAKLAKGIHVSPLPLKCLFCVDARHSHRVCPLKPTHEDESAVRALRSNRDEKGLERYLAALRARASAPEPSATDAGETSSANCMFCDEPHRHSDCPLQPTQQDISSMYKARLSERNVEEMRRIVASLRERASIPAPEKLDFAEWKCTLCGDDYHPFRECPLAPSKADIAKYLALRAKKDGLGARALLRQLRSGVHLPDDEPIEEEEEAAPASSSSPRCSFCVNAYHLHTECPLQPTKFDIVTYFRLLGKGRHAATDTSSSSRFKSKNPELTSFLEAIRNGVHAVPLPVADSSTQSSPCPFCEGPSHRFYKCPFRPTQSVIARYLQLKSAGDKEAELNHLLETYRRNQAAKTATGASKDRSATPAEDSESHTAPRCFFCIEEYHAHRDCPHKPSKKDQSTYYSLMADSPAAAAEFAEAVRTGLHMQRNDPDNASVVSDDSV